MGINKEKRNAVYEKFNGRCAYCGEHITKKQMQVDHIIPQRNFSTVHNCLIHRAKKVDYGLDDMRNLNPSCRFCNNWKKTFSLETFRSEIEAQVERARRYSRNFRMAEKYGLVVSCEGSIKFYFEQL